MAVEHLGLLIVGDPRCRLELVSGRDPTLIVAVCGVIGVDGAAHQAGSVGTYAVVLHGVGIIPGDIAAAGIRVPVLRFALAPDHIERGALDFPGRFAGGVEVRHNALRELDQGEAHEGTLRIGGPGDILTGRRLPAGTAGVQTAHTAGGTGSCFPGGRLHRLSQHIAGADADCAVKDIVASGIDGNTLAMYPLRHNDRQIGVIEMPILTGKRDQSGVCAIFLEPLRTVTGCKIRRPVLQILRHGGGAGGLPEANRVRTQLVHGCGHIVLRPHFVFPVCHAVEIVFVQLLRITFGEGHVHRQPRLVAGRAARDEPVLTVAHRISFLHVCGNGLIVVNQGTEAIPHGGLHRSGAECLVDHQRFAVCHSGLLGLRQTLGESVHAGGDVLLPVQPEIDLLPGIKLVAGYIGNLSAIRSSENTAAGVGQVVGNAGQDIRQVDKDVRFFNPAGFAVCKADLYSFAAVVLQENEGDRFGIVRCGNGSDLLVAALGIKDRQGITGAIPAGGTGNVYLEIAGCRESRISGKGRGGQHSHDCQQGKQQGKRSPPVGLHILRKSLQHEHFPPIFVYFVYKHKKRPHGLCGLGVRYIGAVHPWNGWFQVHKTSFFSCFRQATH